jgi:hypothetical protein
MMGGDKLSQNTPNSCNIRRDVESHHSSKHLHCVITQPLVLKNIDDANLISYHSDYFLSIRVLETGDNKNSFILD